MKYLGILITITLMALMRCSNGASTNRPEKTSTSEEFTLPWGNLFSFISYFSKSVLTSDDQPSSWDSCGEQTCKKEEATDSSQTIIIYDVEQLLPLDKINATNSSTTALEAGPSRRKRDSEESKKLSEDSEARHKDVRPYPGYFLGRKLWYVPLWFSVYYAFYLTCLVVKSVARHRIHYPALLPADQTFERKRSRQKNKKLDSLARRVTDGIRVNTDRYRKYY